MNDVLESRRRIAAALRWRPDWPFALMVAVAWLAVPAGIGVHAEHGDGSQVVTTVQIHDHQGHGMETPPVNPGDGKNASWLPSAGVVLGWTVMSVAMMAPIALPAVRHVGLNSIRSRRRWAMSIFFAVYVAIWVVFGVAASAVTSAVEKALGVDDRALLAALLAVAAGWQLTRIKRRSLNRCWRTVPLPPVGRRADAACARFAWQQSLRCMASCWPLMALMTTIHHSAVAWMIAMTVLIATEELTLFGRHLLRWTALSLSVVAGLVALGA